jgi:hypothetical protein
MRLPDPHDRRPWGSQVGSPFLNGNLRLAIAGSKQNRGNTRGLHFLVDKY